MAKVRINQGDQFTRLVQAPVMDTEAAGTDAYEDVLLVTSDGEVRTNLTAVCATFPAMISLDDGVTDHIYVPVGVQVTLKDLYIPAGMQITGKNGTPASNYTKLYISVW